MSDIVEMISRDDFDKNWENLLPDILKLLEKDDPYVNLRVFRTVSPIFKIIQYLPRSDKLYRKINYSLENLGPALTKKTGVR